MFLAISFSKSSKSIIGNHRNPIWKIAIMVLIFKTGFIKPTILGTRKWHFLDWLFIKRSMDYQRQQFCTFQVVVLVFQTSFKWLGWKRSPVVFLLNISFISRHFFFKKVQFFFSLNARHYRQNYRPLSCQVRNFEVEVVIKKKRAVKANVNSGWLKRSAFIWRTISSVLPVHSPRQLDVFSDRLLVTIIPKLDVPV